MVLNAYRRIKLSLSLFLFMVCFSLVIAFLICTLLKCLINQFFLSFFYITEM